MSCRVAMVMAGGSGSRLGYVPKPAVDLCGKPMVSYVVNVALKVCMHVVLLISWRTRDAIKDLCSDSPAIDCIETSGADYVEDLALATRMFTKPLLILPSDTPFITPESIEMLLSLATQCDGSVVTLSVECSKPVGISVIKEGSDSWCDVCVAESVEFLNVNTPRDLSVARVMCSEDPWRSP